METLLLYSPTLPTFFFMFLFIYFLAYLVVFRSWGPKLRPHASSCIISLAHGTPAAVMAAHAIIRTQTPRSFAHANTALHNMVLEYSIAYFLADLLHLAVFSPNDVLFIAHHLATLFVFTSCRYIVHNGAFAILILLVLAEVTSACQNTWALADARKADVPVASKVYEFLSPIFYVFYSIARGVLGPVALYKMGVFYMSGTADSVIPRWAWLSWMLVIVAAVLVSILWVLNNWKCFFRERADKMRQKLN